MAAAAVFGSARDVAAAPLALTVDVASPACSDARRREDVSLAAPWCTLTPAATRALPGDVVRVRPGTYRGFRPLVSGTSYAPIRFVADGAVTLLPASGSPSALMLVRVGWLILDGFTITGGTNQGVWIEDSSHLDLIRLVIRENPGVGVALLRGQNVVIWSSTVTNNGRAGIREFIGSAGNQFTRNSIVGNGRDGNPYNGDGIQFAGSRTLVAYNTIRANGDAGGHEHGIYAASTARSFVIERNTIDRSPGADVKAQGTGSIRSNRLLGDSLFGLVLSDNPAPVSVVANVVAGRFEHAVLVTSGSTRGQARLWQNTIVQQGRFGSSGNAAALFVITAGSLDVRNNILCYANPDNLGAAFFVNDASRVLTLRSDTNWLCSTDPAGRATAWNGTRSTLEQWRSQTGGLDSGSIASSPPLFDGDFRVTSANLGAGRGTSLGVAADIDGRSFPPTSPDVGAYQHR